MADAPPQVNAFLLCDQAFQQMPTGKWCVIGTFGVIWMRGFPGRYAPFNVFVGLSDFRGNSTVHVRVRDDEGEAVAAVSARIPEFPVPAMAIAEFVFPFPPIEFPRSGSYTVELDVGGQLLSARSFQVREAPEPTPGQLPPGVTRPPPPEEAP